MSTTTATFGSPTRILCADLMVTVATGQDIPDIGPATPATVRDTLVTDPATPAMQVHIPVIPAHCPLIGLTSPPTIPISGPQIFPSRVRCPMLVTFTDLGQIRIDPIFRTRRVGTVPGAILPPIAGPKTIWRPTGPAATRV